MKGQYFLIVVGSFSKWLEVMKCKIPMCFGTIRFLLEHFARFGILDTILSDNETQFTAKVFKDFCKACPIVHISTAPYHPQSKGQVERFVDTFKQALKMSDGNEYVDNILQF